MKHALNHIEFPGQCKTHRHFRHLTDQNGSVGGSGTRALRTLLRDMQRNSQLAVTTRAALYKMGALETAMSVEMPLCPILSAMEVVGVR